MILRVPETTNPLDVVVNKSWFDENGNPVTGENLDETFVAKVQLMRKTDNGDYVPVKVEQGTDGNIITEVAASTEESQVRLTKENDWSYTWNDLPRVQPGGDGGADVVHRYAYKIEEVKVDGYVVSFTETETETVKTYALNNYEKPDNRTTEVTVHKSWQNMEGQTIEGTSEKLPSESTVRTPIGLRAASVRWSLLTRLRRHTTIVRILQWNCQPKSSRQRHTTIVWIIL